jgi:tripartite-type tricarboxylate transporter receptor subunit TctC
VPTAIEAGFKDYEAVGWFGLLAPAGTPSGVVEQLSGEVTKAMATPAISERATQQGATPIGNRPGEFERFLRDEIAKWSRVIQQLGIKLD